MNYLLLICSDGIPTADKAATMQREIPGWTRETLERGVSVYGHELAAPAAAKTVRVRDGETLVSDGPFIEAKEFVGGFDILDCADLDEAIDVAARHPVSWFHMVEVRPFATDPATEGRSFMADDSGRGGPAGVCGGMGPARGQQASEAPRQAWPSGDPADDRPLHGPHVPLDRPPAPRPAAQRPPGTRGPELSRRRPAGP